MTDSPFDDDITAISEAQGDSLEATQRYEQKRMRWEASCLKRILTAAGKSELIAVLSKRCHDKSGEYRLTVEDFHLELPNFPIKLFFEKMAFRSLGRLDTQRKEMRNVDNNILVDKFYEIDYEDRDQPRGLIFEWLHHGSPYKIIHNHHITNLVHPWTRLAISVSKTGGKYQDTVYLEDLDSYLHAINWVKRD